MSFFNKLRVPDLIAILKEQTENSFRMIIEFDKEKEDLFRRKVKELREFIKTTDESKLTLRVEVDKWKGHLNEFVRKETDNL